MATPLLTISLQAQENNATVLMPVLSRSYWRKDRKASKETQTLNTSDVGRVITPLSNAWLSLFRNIDESGQTAFSRHTSGGSKKFLLTLIFPFAFNLTQSSAS